MKRILFIILLICIISMPIAAKVSGKSGSGKSSVPWGKQVDDFRNQTATMLAICQAGDNPGDVTQFFSNSVTIGPVLWQELNYYAPSISSYGVPVKIKTDARSARKLKGSEVEKVFSLKQCQDYILDFCNATYSYASVDQRKRCYELGATDIKGRPITVSEQGKNIMLILLDEHNKIRLLELLNNDYETNAIVVEVTRLNFINKLPSIEFLVKNVSTKDYYLIEPSAPDVIADLKACKLKFISFNSKDNNSPSGTVPKMVLIPAHTKMSFAVSFKNPLTPKCKKQNYSIQITFVSKSDAEKAKKLNGEEKIKYLHEHALTTTPDTFNDVEVH